MDDDDGMQLNQERLKLILTQPMPSYSFTETTFSVYIALVDQYDQPQVLHGGTVITLQLLHADSKKPVNPAMLVIDSKQPLTLNSKGGCEVKLRVAEDNKLGGAMGGLRKFAIKAVAPHRDDVDPLITEPVTIVRYRLQVRDNPARPVPKEWFKDEGGRENCVEMQVHLLDKDGHEVTTRRVKLRLVLLYDNLGRVQNQEILKLSPDSKMAIDDEGKAMLRLRIEEVSKNHQKQAFRIKVEPDTDDNPTAVDVSSDVSPPIAVYSKRIKNFNSEQLGMLGLPAYDAGKYLVGFYKEVEVQGGETRMVLITTDRVHGLQPHEQQSATTVLLDEMRKGSQSVFELQRFNTVEKMKEAAGVYYWKKMSNMERGM
eukprot:TRINITY_DN6528_c0_g1_i1.p1 TRINITY_DN6528_c0_g1~~TRINITY_DN6528_c0_g1_i1.p1  ORF type:complete len:371 (-),score=137.85 TRINITY_DN6528_c0_g1_i1:680-1792(-)